MFLCDCVYVMLAEIYISIILLLLGSDIYFNSHIDIEGIRIFPQHKQPIISQESTAILL